MAASRNRASDKPPKRRPKKPQPSFEAPQASGPASGWVYRSDPDVIEPPAAAPSATVVRLPAPRAPRPAAPELNESGAFERRADAATLPMTLLLTTILAPVGWLLGRGGRR